MLTQIALTDLLAAVIARVETGTGLRCYDAVPDGAAAPFYSVQLTAKRPGSTKTMLCDAFAVWLHCIAPGDGCTAVNNLVRRCEEAMSEDVTLAAPAVLLSQREVGLERLAPDADGLFHAVLAFELRVCRGFQTKI